MLAAVKQNGLALYAFEALKADREIVLQVVRENGDSLQYASEALKADCEIVLAASLRKGVHCSTLPRLSRPTAISRLQPTFKMELLWSARPRLSRYIYSQPSISLFPPLFPAIGKTDLAVSHVLHRSSFAFEWNSESLGLLCSDAPVAMRHSWPHAHAARNAASKPAATFSIQHRQAAATADANHLAFADDDHAVAAASRVAFVCWLGWRLVVELHIT